MDVATVHYYYYADYRIQYIVRYNIIPIYYIYVYVYIYSDLLDI